MSNSSDRTELLHAASLLLQADTILVLYVNHLEEVLESWKFSYNERRAESYAWEYDEVSDISDVLSQVRRKLEYLIVAGAKTPHEKSTLLQRVRDGQQAPFELNLPPDFWDDPVGDK